MKYNSHVPMLIPYEPEEFWDKIRLIVREEIKQQVGRPADKSLLDTPGLKQKPLFKVNELCALFQISRPTLYEWIKDGKLKPVKIRSRVFFLGADVRQLLA